MDVIPESHASHAVAASTEVPSEPDALSARSMRALINRIHALKDEEHRQIFRLLQNETSKYTTNLNGVFVNMAHIEPITQRKLLNLVDYFEKQAQRMDESEQMLQHIRSSCHGGHESGGLPCDIDRTSEHGFQSVVTDDSSGVQGGEGASSSSSSVMDGGDRIADDEPAYLGALRMCEQQEEAVPSMCLQELANADSTLLTVEQANRKRDLTLNRARPKFSGPSARIAQRCQGDSTTGDDAHGAAE